MDDPVDRRDLLKGTGVAALSALASDLAAAAPEDDDATTVPEDARTVEAGFEAFLAKWEVAGPVITTGQFGRYLTGKTFNLYVADDDRVYTLHLGPEGGAAFSPGAATDEHVSLVVDESDWIDILYGEYSGLAPALAGRTFAPKSEVNAGAILAIVLYVLAHVPASLVHDADSNAETLAGVLERRGSTDCGSAIGHSAGPVETFRAHREETLTGTANRAPDVTAELARRTAALSYDDLPGEAVAAAKRQLRSILGVSFAATTMEPVRRFLDSLDALEGRAGTVVGGGSASAANAAMANAYLAQMLEWEDWTYMAHTGSAVVPTALAAAERAGASGKELLTAIVLGNEIAGRVGAFLTDPTNLGQSLPVHQSECPFVAGKLLGLDDEGLRDASAIACTQAQTTTMVSWPSPTKGLIGGEPVGTSVRAAQLADAGMVGRRDHLGNVAGYWYRVSDIHDPRNLELAYRGLGEEYFLASEYFDKRYPCDGFTQTAVHAALSVREQLLADGVDPAEDPDAIEEVNVRMNTAMAATGSLFNAGEYDYVPEKILDDADPGWTYTALLFDGKYPLAAALVEGELTHRQYRPGVVGDDRVRRVYESVEPVTDVSVDQFGAEVNVVTSDAAYESVVGAGRAAADRTRYESFVGCMSDVTAGFDGSDKLELAAGDVLAPGRIRAIDRAVADLESYEDISAFTRLL